MVTFLSVGLVEVWNWHISRVFSWWDWFINMQKNKLFYEIVSLTCNRINYSIQSHCHCHWQCSIQSAFLHDSPLKITVTPKTESRGSKMTPCHFCGNLKFSVPTSKTMIFLMILIIKNCKHLWYRPNKDPFIAFNFDLHLFCKTKCSALQAV